MAKICFFVCLLIVSCNPVRLDIHEPQPSPVELVINEQEHLINDSITVITVVDSIMYCPEDIAQNFLDTLKHLMGIVELTGKNDGPEIKRMLAICGLPEGNPWCAAMIALALVLNEKVPPNQCAWSPSYFPRDRVIWEKGQRHLIPAGSIAGLWFKNLNRIGHVLVVLHDTGRGWVLCFEGNTNADGSRDGNMSAVRMRRKDQLHVASDWLK